MTNQNITIHIGNALQTLKGLPAESLQSCVTSPPYWGLRDYGHAGQLGHEPTPEAFVQSLVEVFREVRRVLKPDGTLWLNIGDSYAQQGTGAQGVNGQRANRRHTQRKLLGRPEGIKPKDLVGIPWMTAFALRAEGWYLRQDIIWNKPNPMPESVRDRCTKAHEYLFLLSKSANYYYDHEAIKEPADWGAPGNASHRGEREYSNGDKYHRTKSGLADYARKKRESAKKGSFNGKTEVMADTGQNAFRAVTDTRNKRSVWTVPLRPYAEAHFATFPKALIQPCILAGTKPGDTVLDPFAGSGTTGEVALDNGRRAVLIEINPEYEGLIEQRTNVTMGLALG